MAAQCVWHTVWRTRETNATTQDAKNWRRMQIAAKNEISLDGAEEVRSHCEYDECTLSVEMCASFSFHPRLPLFSHSDL